MLGDPAIYAAVVVECAADQGGFWPLHDRFMADDTTLFTEAGLRRQVTFEGMDYDELAQCVSDGDSFAAVAASYEEGESRGVTGTPTVFVDGERVDLSYEAIEAAVLEAADAE